MSHKLRLTLLPGRPATARHVAPCLYFRGRSVCRDRGRYLTFLSRTPYLNGRETSTVSSGLLSRKTSGRLFVTSLFNFFHCPDVDRDLPEMSRSLFAIGRPYNGIRFLASLGFAVTMNQAEDI